MDNDQPPIISAVATANAAGISEDKSLPSTSLRSSVQIPYTGGNTPPLTNSSLAIVPEEEQDLRNTNQHTFSLYDDQRSRATISELTTHQLLLTTHQSLLAVIEEQKKQSEILQKLVLHVNKSKGKHDFSSSTPLPSKL